MRKFVFAFGILVFACFCALVISILTILLPLSLSPSLSHSLLPGCRNVEEFQCLNRIEEGTFGVVYRALDKKFDEIVALKRLKMEKEKEGFPITSLREINTLLKVKLVGMEID